MRSVLLGLLIVLSACMSGARTTVSSEVRAMHVAAIAVSGASVAVENASSVTLELRRRAATGEVIGVATLHPGQRDVFSASPRRTVELVNRSKSPAKFVIRAVSAGDDSGAQIYAAILGQEPL